MDHRRKMWSPSFVCPPLFEQQFHSEFNVVLVDENSTQHFLDKIIGFFGGPIYLSK